jgi:GTP-binding protein Era
LRNEVPHSVAVAVEKLSERDTEWVADITIYIDRASQRPILLGRKGRLIRTVQEMAEAELSEMYDKKVRLYLWIKVQKDWAKNPWLLKQMGYI